MGRVRLASGIRKNIQYKTAGRLITQEGKGMEMIIGQDWLETMKPSINWDTKEIELAAVETEQIPEWLQDQREVFEDFLEGELPPERERVDHAINLTQP